jgi:integrase
MARTGLPRPSTLVKHHVSLEFNRLPDLMKSLHQSKADKVTKLAFEFLVLTASRTKEVCEATWDEIDLEQNIWTLAAERTKTGLIHRVPLTERMIEILATAKQLPRPSVFIFPNQRRGVPLSYNTLLFLLQKRLKISATVHGLRSSFKDWASETTNFSNELSEMALSHKIPNKVEAAYRRGYLLEKRRLLMQTWSDYVLGIENTVIPFNLKLYTQGV